MYMAIVSLHVILSISLIGIVILQPGKGGDIGAAFGGAGSSTIFGPRGPGNLLQKITTGVAIAFMFTSIGLAWYSNEALLSGTGDVMEELERRNEARISGDEEPVVADPGDVSSEPGDQAETTPDEGSPEE